VRRRLATALALLLLPAAARATGTAWVVTFDFDGRQTIGLGTGHEDERAVHECQVVTLGPDVVRIDTEASSRVHDFARRRTLALDHERRTVARVSLFADVARRNDELRNRMRQATLLGSVGRLDPAYETFALETVFGMVHADEGVEVPPTGLQRVEDGATVSWVRRGTTVASFTFDGTAVPPAHARAWRRFVHHEWRLHPQVRDRLLARGEVPAVVRTTYRPFASAIARADWTRVDVATGPLPEREAPAGYADEPLVDARVAPALAAARAADPASREALTARAREALEEDRVLDAWLTCLRAKLATGRALPIEREVLAAAARAGERARIDALMDAVGGAADPERAADVLLWLDGLGTDDPAHRAVLDVFAASALATLDETDRAIERLVGALLARPDLAGALGDLGELFYGPDMTTAWTCWDAARRLAPGHPLLAGVDEWEQRLLDEYPRFF